MFVWINGCMHACMHERMSVNVFPAKNPSPLSRPIPSFPPFLSAKLCLLISLPRRLDAKSANGNQLQPSKQIIPPYHFLYTITNLDEENSLILVTQSALEITRRLSPPTSI
ncbi:hypothetical protein NE237_022916 [Protea cynaroides]|uniref:Uncharacterized protein n=1 Tax=Protea cynaroides TaxID=273540 RepID=A0A9Q0HAR8_9MAGN|nr:hypothetical protein NE237_022916 [Protea cynaroides]